MVTGVAVAGAIDLAKLVLSAYFQACRMARLSDEDREKLYQEELAKFRARRPEDLPEV